MNRGSIQMALNSPQSVDGDAAGTDKPAKRLADQVYERLLEDIVRGVLPAGTPMAELDLCQQLNVSRTPVREALIKLAEADLVHIYPQRGTFVAPISREAFRNAQFIREHLECALVAEAVRFIDTTSIRELTDIIERQESAATPSGFYDEDEAFHRAIVRISRFGDVWHVVRQTKIHFDRVRHKTLTEDTSHIPLLIGQHREILDGLANCNEAQAVAAMRRHLREVFHRADGIFAREEAAADGTAKRRK